ncbi:hypothetical protein QBC39DRAFT_26278 [Podospora conica]|nr:hypothetical protein QBC39DRAFT_26278 [Schizothecium conicum]
MPRRRNYPSEEGLRVQAYKEAEEEAKLNLDCAQAAAAEGDDDEAMEFIYSAREDGVEAERLRIESADYYGDEFCDGHERAIEWIHENILAKADELEEVLRDKLSEDMKQASRELSRACQQLHQACHRVQQACQESSNVDQAVLDMYEVEKGMEQARQRVDALDQRLDYWDSLEEDDDDDDDDDDDSEEYDDDSEGDGYDEEDDEYDEDDGYDEGEDYGDDGGYYNYY